MDQNDQNIAERATTAEAASNIAFVKYWGARDLERAIPVNPSISMTLSVCRSICSATFFPGATGLDEILLEQQGVLGKAPRSFSGRIQAQLDRLRAWAGEQGRFRIATRNTFPSAAGIASSASGFAALTTAVVAALGRRESAAKLSELARRSGSGSASRSVLGGFVEWPVAGGGEEDGDAACHAAQLAGEDHWPLCDLIAIVERGAKGVSSLDGHARAATSPHFVRRLELLPARLDTVRRAIAARDLAALGPVVEEEAIELHLIAMSSRPSIFYWRPATLAVLEAVRDLRRQGYGAWSTMDAGANVHVLCERAHVEAVGATLRAVDGVDEVIEDHVGGGPVVRPGAEI